MMLVDSHCHINYKDFAEDLDEVVARAGRAGVGLMVNISSRLDSFPDVLAVAERFPNVYATVGVHPHEAASVEADIVETLTRLAQHPKVVGIGESGLDYFYDHSPRDAQQASFRAHIAVARTTNLPLVVHTRDADADTIQILQEEMEQGAFPALIHCFSGGADLAKPMLDLGFTLSFSGIVTFRKAEPLRQVLAGVPLDKVLVETDAPYLAPEPHRGKRNEPAYTRITAERVAKVLDVPLEQLAAATTDNFFRLFTKVPRPAEMAAA